MAEIKHFIVAKDKTGKIRNLSMVAWSKETGKKYNAIAKHYAAKRAGVRISNMQVVGSAPLDASIKVFVKKEAVISESQQMINTFLSKSLVPKAVVTPPWIVYYDCV